MRGTVRSLVGWILVSFLPSLTGLAFPPGAWYAGLDKPEWTPPSWLFGPAWTTLYLLMGIAAWRVWSRQARHPAISLFLLQLGLNALWTPLFFGLHRPDLAFFEILVLVAGVIATSIAFWRVDRIAAALLVPYLAWLSYAAALNGALWRMNPPG